MKHETTLNLTEILRLGLLKKQVGTDKGQPLTSREQVRKRLKEAGISPTYKPEINSIVWEVPKSKLKDI